MLHLALATVHDNRATLCQNTVSATCRPARCLIAPRDTANAAATFILSRGTVEVFRLQSFGPCLARKVWFKMPRVGASTRMMILLGCEELVVGERLILYFVS